MASGNSPDFSAFETSFENAPAAGDANPVAAGPQFADPQPSGAVQPAGAQSPPPAKPKPPKPPFSVYTLMLMMCIVFLAVGCVLLVTELQRYNFEIQQGKRLF
ncbi:MAG: hypothetical protein U1A77_23320 [Pirellulales bacterium]